MSLAMFGQKLDREVTMDRQDSAVPGSVNQHDCTKRSEVIR